ncbi:hypothetical protein AB5I41_24565 [Sphingomonas sp. MMS24-JH45]
MDLSTASASRARSTRRCPGPVCSRLRRSACPARTATASTRKWARRKSRVRIDQLRRRQCRHRVPGRLHEPAFLDDQFIGTYKEPLARINSTFYLDTQVASVRRRISLLRRREQHEHRAAADHQWPAGQRRSTTDAGTYDAIGRRYYAGARIKF